MLAHMWVCSLSHQPTDVCLSNDEKRRPFLDHDEEDFCNLGCCLCLCHLSSFQKQPGKMQLDKSVHHNCVSHPFQQSLSNTERMALLEHSFSEYLCLASLNSDICSVYIVGVLWINLLPFWTLTFAVYCTVNSVRVHWMSLFGRSEPSHCVHCTLCSEQC